MPSTPTNIYWDFKKNPFRESELSGKDLSLFKCRDTELNDLRNTLDNTLVAIVGSLGVGKSSFLNKISNIINNEKDLSIFHIDLVAGTELSLYLTILKLLLINIQYRKKILN